MPLLRGSMHSDHYFQTSMKLVEQLKLNSKGGTPWVGGIIVLKAGLSHMTKMAAMHI